MQHPLGFKPKSNVLTTGPLGPLSNEWVTSSITALPKGQAKAKLGIPMNVMNVYSEINSASEFSTTNLTRTARRTPECIPIRPLGLLAQPVPVQPSLRREWESVEIQLWPQDDDACVACLPFLCPGFPIA